MWSKRRVGRAVRPTGSGRTHIAARGGAALAAGAPGSWGIGTGWGKDQDWGDPEKGPRGREGWQGREGDGGALPRRGPPVPRAGGGGGGGGAGGGRGAGKGKGAKEERKGHTGRWLLLRRRTWAGTGRGRRVSRRLTGG